MSEQHPTERGDTDDERRSEQERRVDQASLLARLDERTRAIERDMTKIEKGVTVIAESMDGKYVTREEFRPYKAIITGMVGAVGLAVLGAVLRLIILGHP